jgi:hypothetical protein
MRVVRLLNVCTMSAQTFYDKEQHALLWTVSLATRGIITISGIPNRRNYCVNSIVYRVFQEKRSKFCEVIVSVIVGKKFIRTRV